MLKVGEGQLARASIRCGGLVDSIKVPHATLPSSTQNISPNKHQIGGVVNNL
jgi:hypothetical protein